MRATSWKTIIVVRTPDSDPRLARPTKTAYRYIRGNANWQNSKIGRTSDHNSIPAACKDMDSDDEESEGSEEEQVSEAILYDDSVDFIPEQDDE